jgi:hypothetical protein
MRRHKAMGKPLLFAGGLWTWSGFLPDMARTERTMRPALKGCLEESVKEVMATCWGDDGCETNHMFTLYGLAMFSETCYLGEAADGTAMADMGAFVSGFDADAMEAMNAFQFGSDRYLGKHLVWNDILFNLTGVDWKTYDYDGILKPAIETIRARRGGRRAVFYDYAALVLEVARKKAMIAATLRDAYKSGQSLSAYSKEILPELYKDYENLCALHLNLWRSTYKMNGWEVISCRYGAMMNRVKYATGVIEAYERGELAGIEELEHVILYDEIPYGGFGRMAVTSLNF